MSDVRAFTVAPDDDGIRLDRWFKRHLPEASFNIVSRWARTGQLRVDGKRAAPGDRIEAGQVIRVPPAEPPADPKPKIVRPELSEDEIAFVNEIVIHRDPQAIVVNKPPGLATQGGTKTKQHLDGLLDGLANERGERPKLVHRLDKDTSGVLLLARSARAAGFFSKAFSGRTARKVYWALVVGVPEVRDGYIDLPLGKQPGTGGEKMHVDESETGLTARTRYRVIDRAGNRTAWVELQPLTGRTHQLRVHMAAIGHPIVGDGKYGGQDAFLTGAISRKLHLHARRLRIDHPDSGQIDVTAELPAHFAETLAGLGFDPADGDLPLDEVKFAETPEGKRRALTAAAKSRRRERKGERRSRGGRGERRLMHPARKFHIADRAEMAALVRAEGFGTVIVQTEAGLRAVHVPLLLVGDRLLFHVSRGNALHAALAAGAEALVVVNGPHAYVSADWYGLEGRVPTWNYVAVELNGRAETLGEDELIRLLDALTETQEARLAPKPPWARDAMDTARFDVLLKAITGFALTVAEWRGTAKLDQSKPPEVRARIAAALRARGDEAMAALMDPVLPAGGAGGED